MTKNVKTAVAKFVIHNFFTAQTMDTKPEKNFGRGLAEPDKAHSIKELYEMATRGIDPLGHAFPPVFNEDFFIPDVRTLDPTDVEMYRNGLKARQFKLQDMQKQLADLDGDGTPDRLQTIEAKLAELEKAQPAAKS